jgi:hypothetical protein
MAVVPKHDNTKGLAPVNINFVARRRPSDPKETHGGYLDDITLRLPPGFGEDASAQVGEVARRLAAGGLETSVRLWRRGQRFTAEERRRLLDLRIPFVDASLPHEERGFTIVGVPVGENSYERHLDKHLFDDKLWRLGWQLAGMARTDFPVALRVFGGSFTQRFMQR